MIINLCQMPLSSNTAAPSLAPGLAPGLERGLSVRSLPESCARTLPRAAVCKWLRRGFAAEGEDGGGI